MVKHLESWQLSKVANARVKPTRIRPRIAQNHPPDPLTSIAPLIPYESYHITFPVALFNDPESNALAMTMSEDEELLARIGKLAGKSPYIWTTS